MDARSDSFTWPEPACLSGRSAPRPYRHRPGRARPAARWCASGVNSRTTGIGSMPRQRRVCADGGSCARCSAVTSVVMAAPTSEDTESPRRIGACGGCMKARHESVHAETQKGIGRPGRHGCGSPILRNPPMRISVKARKGSPTNEHFRLSPIGCNGLSSWFLRETIGDSKQHWHGNTDDQESAWLEPGSVLRRVQPHLHEFAGT